MEQGKPLIYLHGIVPGRYLVIWPTFVTGDNRRDLSFEVAFEPGESVRLPELAVEEDARRSYAFHVVKQRLHQAGFRERVLAAYRRTCSLCQLRTKNCSTRPTSSRTGNLEVIQSFRTASPCASCITPHSTAISSGFDLTSSSRSAKTSSARPMDRCSVMVYRDYTART
jgi:hypothetical protein